MAQLLEVMMLVCFGLSWPFNIMKSWRSRTARGKSLLFECLVIIGYCCGLAGKIMGGNLTYVVAVYVLDILMVSTDLVLTIRNVFLDKAADRRAAKAAKTEQTEKEAQA